jgi:pimeloyl-ACP methyl ester carboxylesterase
MAVPGLGDAFESGQEPAGLHPLALAAGILAAIEFLRVRQWPRRIPGLSALCAALRLTFVLLVIDVVVGMMVLPAPLLTNKLTAEELNLSRTWQLEDVMSGDGTAQLQVGVMDRGFDDWIVMSNPNGVRFEQMGDFLMQYGMATKRNVLAYNYRGVGDSTGHAKSANDLLDDGRAVTAWLVKRRHAQPHRVLFHGWSLGGPVALHLKALYPAACVVNDRSFSSLASVGQHMFTTNRALGASVGSALMAVGAMVVPGTFNAIVVGAFSGALLGAVGAFNPLLPHLLKALQWEMDAVMLWNNAGCATDRRCIVLYHQDDGIIGQSASLHTAVAGSGTVDGSNAPQLVRLNHTFANPLANHMFSFPMPAAVHWDGLLHAIQSACMET